jgi:phosphosulfolactate synthase (CoM biosynthesis protein A)
VIFEARARAAGVAAPARRPNVNLGNIGAEDVIALETLRRGLRSTRSTCSAGLILPV